MLDRSIDSPDYPGAPPPFKPGDVWLCLAPHPDDEVLGCGGTLALAAAAGVQVHVLVMTPGQQGYLPGAPVADRLGESAQAAHCLGLPPPQCWSLSDRELRYTPALIQRVVNLLAELQPQVMLAPALTEPHPDHQVAALTAMAAARTADSLQYVWFYESGAPLVANTLVAIDGVVQQKWAALDAFASQETVHPYTAYAKALAQVRALGLSGSQHAEAFFRVSRTDLLLNHGLATSLGWPVHRMAAGLAQSDADLPLVSVLIRSMGRPCLHDALASVVCQTYPNLEVVVINATDSPHPPLPNLQQRCTAQVVRAQPSGASGLNRSEAANTAIKSAKGALALFLDDDDLIDAGHIQRLVQALFDHPQAVAAYAGVQVVDVHGQVVRDYDIPWNALRLYGLNFLPIHAVLFRLTPVIKHGLAFEPTFPVLEDWDFWVQLAHHGAFIHVPGVSATYRQGQGQSQLGQAEHPHHWAKWHQPVLQRHIQRWGVEPLVSSLAWYALRLDISEQQIQKIQRDMEQSQNELTHAQLQKQQLMATQCDLEQQLQHSKHLLHTLENTRLVRWSQRFQQWLRKPPHA